MLIEAHCASTDFPEDRLGLSNYYHPDDKSLQRPIRGGHFLREDIGAFDAPLFSISSAEAAGMDPQQRNLLETTYRAFKNVGMPLKKTAGSKTSVYTGCYVGTGLSASILANWLSWLYNLTGTSTTIDTACSSSLKNFALDGVRVKALACDVTDADSLKAVLDKCAASMPETGGCFQSAMVLRDAVFEKMSCKDGKTCIDPKVRRSWNLHTLLPKGMDFFVFLSSISGIVNSGGQANYAAGNTSMDALADYRVAQGEKGSSLDLGAMTDEGLLAENEELLNRVLARGNLLPVSSKELFAVLDFHCNPEVVLTARNCQTLIGIQTPANVKTKGLEQANWVATPFFRHMHLIDSASGASAAGTEVVIDFRKMFAEATSLLEAGAMVSLALLKKLTRNLSTLKVDEVDLRRPLHTYGVDSLLAVELRSWFARKFGADISIFEISGASSFSSVGISVARKSRYYQASWIQ
ncbi:Highly reducing polyketide synthase [Lachnellula occidentalis]|uniref:Highly reducing polyketide synthase n=1 Tax=Lachnellula occidentalis TaxID=215460 RepID=A0A8H8UBA5_9HELO|nr:Highly reducing polyketide synthase [Lachnellula occidentalis]